MAIEKHPIQGLVNVRIKHHRKALRGYNLQQMLEGDVENITKKEPFTLW